jgi:thioredoxin reductase (NADPH)
MNPVIYQGMQPGGQLTTTNEVDWPGNPEGITGPEMIAVQAESVLEQMFVMAGLLK